MRSSLSCDNCRRSKVRCVHDGSPPCQRCDKSNIAGCKLSRPIHTPKSATPRRRQRVVEPSPSVTPSPIVVTVLPTTPERTINTEPQSYNRRDVEAHIKSLDTGIILKCLHIFHDKFPELAIVHVPTMLASIQSTWLPETTTLIAAVLAVTRAHLSVLNASLANKLLSGEDYAQYVRDSLSELMLQPPKIYVVQALLIITLYEWGSRDFHKAWIYCGVAIRIMQALHSLRVAPYPLDTTSERDTGHISRAIETRTYWACFIMDCMVNSGTYNPPMLPMSEMKKLKIPRPLGVVEFAFGNGSIELGAADSRALDMTQGFEILVAGFDIWTQLMTFIFNDGRKAPGMCAPANCPWVPGSPWLSTKTQLDAWRASQPSQLFYPDVPVAVHMTLGYGETFTYLNLIYYVSTLMLHREYFPFLPTLESEPQGPVDHPMLEAEAPEGWWNDSAETLFGAAEQIAKILKDASDCGVHLLTPFAGFCAFSAGYINLYVYRYPRMNLGRSPDAHKHLQMCLDYLYELRKVWRIADGWLKTIQHASLLYERAVSDRKRYQGRTRADFHVLHQSVHEFRVVDRSDQHTQEIDGADNTRQQATNITSAQVESVDTNTLLSQLMAEVSSNLDEQGAWSQWWPPMEEIDLPMPMEQ